MRKTISLKLTFSLISKFRKNIPYIVCFFVSIIFSTLFYSQQLQAQSPYFTGDGGRGLRLAVLEPTGRGLSAEEQWILPLIQGSITGDFNKYSAITVIDRQNLEKIMREQALSLTGISSDRDLIRIGQITNSRYIVTGTVSKTANNYMLELAVSNAETGERKASYPPKPVSLLTLENLSAIREASADLLRQLGVRLTERGLMELRGLVNITQLQAETSLAKGITAQKRGTEVAALSYFFQAAAIDPSLLEAVNRSSSMSANISSGNIGSDIRNDIQWRNDWIARLKETENAISRMVKDGDPPYKLYYSTGIQHGKINYKTETVDLSIPINLRVNGVWFDSVRKSVMAVYNGLNATGRKKDWGLANWPQKNLTKTAIGNHYKTVDISVVFELVNEKNRVIGKQTAKLVRSFGFSWDQNKGDFPYQWYKNKGKTIDDAEDLFHTIKFNNVKTKDISDSLTIRIVLINKATPEKARLHIIALSGTKWQEYAAFRVNGNTLMGAELNGQTVLNIPNEVSVWGERTARITSIGRGAFSHNQLTNVKIPNSVTSIGDFAFMHNQLTNVVIPNSVTSIGNFAFMHNQLPFVIIPDSVTSIGSQAFSENQLVTKIISKNITKIEQGTFSKNRLAGITIPNRVTEIGLDAFSNNQLTSVAIPDSVTSIGGNAFSNNQLTNVTIPNSVKTIGKEAFSNNQITRITIAGGHRLWTDVFVTSSRSSGGQNFEKFYNDNGAKAGTYTWENNKWNFVGR